MYALHNIDKIILIIQDSLIIIIFITMPFTRILNIDKIIPIIEDYFIIIIFIIMPFTRILLYYYYIYYTYI